MNSEPTLDGTVKHTTPREYEWGLTPAAQINLSDEQAADLIRCLPVNRLLSACVTLLSIVHDECERLRFPEDTP